MLFNDTLGNVGQATLRANVSGSRHSRLVANWLAKLASPADSLRRPADRLKAAHVNSYRLVPGLKKKFDSSYVYNFGQLFFFPQIPVSSSSPVIHGEVGRYFRELV